MRAEALFFSASAGLALLILVRHSLKRYRPGRAVLLWTVLLAAALLREVIVHWMVGRSGATYQYRFPASPMQVGPVNLTAVGGWLFLTYTSYHLALMIQRRCGMGTNRLLALALTGLVASTIAYAVEVVGIETRLWEWREGYKFVRWLPFGMPFDGIEGWTATAVLFTLATQGVPEKWLSPRPVVNAAAIALICSHFLLDLFSDRALGISPRKLFFLAVLLPAALVAGIVWRRPERPD